MLFTVHVVTVDRTRAYCRCAVFYILFPDSTPHVLVRIDAHEARAVVVLENDLVKKSPVEEVTLLAPPLVCETEVQRTWPKPHDVFATSAPSWTTRMRAVRVDALACTTRT